MQDSENPFVFSIEAGNKDGIRKNAVPPIPVENLGKGETKMKFASSILKIIGWGLALGSENKESSILYEIASWFE